MEDMAINALAQKQIAIDIIVNVINQVYIVQIVTVKIVKINHQRIVLLIGIQFLKINKTMKKLFVLAPKVVVTRNIVNALRMVVNVILLVGV